MKESSTDDRRTHPTTTSRPFIRAAGPAIPGTGHDSYEHAQPGRTVHPFTL